MTHTNMRAAVRAMDPTVRWTRRLAVGSVIGLIETGPQAVLRVAPAGTPVAPADETLIPFVDAYVDSVSLEERRITVDWSSGYQ